jgi:hypothetical protein
MPYAGSNQTGERAIKGRSTQRPGEVHLKMIYVLIAAVSAGAGVAAGAGVGAARSVAAATPGRVADTEPVAAEPAGVEPTAERRSSAAIDGEVLEVLEVPKYTYLRLGEKGTEGTWVAVPSATIAVGARAHVADAMRMNDFTSTALERTFAVIYFGLLDGGRPAYGAAPDRGPNAFGQNPHASPATLGASGPISDPHAPLGPVAVKPVDRAPGPTGRTVAELVTQRGELAGKMVRVHATVVKATPGVLGRTYLHLRDGSGDAATGTYDVAATTEATPAVGDTIVIEGVVAIDRDIGSGYKFPTIVENARILSTL